MTQGVVYTREDEKRLAAELETTPKVKVLNGEVGVGDTIAYAVRAGSWMDMRIAIVDEITDKPHEWEDKTVPVLKVTVTQASDAYATLLPRKTSVSVLDRVVKL